MSNPFTCFYPQCSQFLRDCFCLCLTLCPPSSKVIPMPQTRLLRNWRVRAWAVIFDLYINHVLFSKKIEPIRFPFFLFLILLGTLYTRYLVNNFYLTCFEFLFVVSWLYMRHHNDPYGLFHLSLNKLPFEDPNSLPETEWLNMGYWKVFSDRISIFLFFIMQRLWIGCEDVSGSM